MDEVKGKNVVWKKVGNIAFYVVLAIVLIYAIFALFSDKEENQISFFGTTALAVQSDSMAPTFDKDDLIFINTDFDANELKIGDVITFIERDGDVVFYNTHRIVDIVDSNGFLRFVTKGDAAPEGENDPVWKTADEVVGVWNERAWSGFGGVVDGFTGFIKSSTGFFLLIVLPALLFLAYEVYRFIKVYGDYNRKKGQIDRTLLQEQAIAEAKRQLEEELKNKE